MTHSDNPLLIGQGIPPFNAITPDHVVPAVTQLLSELETAQRELETTVTPTWAGLVEPLTALEERLGWTWGAIGHLMGVKNSPELRAAYEAVEPKLVQFSSQLSQSQPLYQAFKALREGTDWDGLAPGQQRIVEAALRDAELAGVGLTGEPKERFNAIDLELAELSTRFSNHVLDATKAFQLKLTQPDEVAGLPASWLSLAAQTARQKGDATATPEAGPWVVTLDFPSFGPFLKYGDRPQLRETVYRAYITRAASGEWDNNPLIERILALRLEKAQILGFNSFAELSLARKMAPSVAAVESLLEELRQVSYPAAQREFQELQAFAQTSNLQPWDIAYWSEKQRQQKFDLDSEALRPYFALPEVLKGLLNLAERIFKVAIAPADGQAPIWHPDVRYFEVRDHAGSPMAYFYLDPYSRPAEKRGGAWMDDCVGRAKIGGKTRLPVAYLVCNQMPPVDDQPSLMSFDEVTTLFHEFGHGLQHMLTQVDYAGAAGIRNVEWDAVELPSQFMENWCYDRATLFAMAHHYQTGAPLPEAEYQKLLAARTYQSGMGMLRQLHFSLVDLALHHRYQPGGTETPQDLRWSLVPTTTVIPPLPEDSFLCAFGHIFSGGYAAGYYSYKWAEVLSADAFAAFEEVGLENEAAVQAVGQRFRETVLGLGGSVPPMTVFKSFRGREPQTEALLRHTGLLS
ncbi:M3 family metallopeptidase [Spirulina sp. CCNP1310]|uniref:M3 family metallopeptidase n=1 Tax=Spirulina sp. CCNP1310 TaxID=3110249 RepID=UPI002B210D36|nr:M3 family metallopeptidase [Spirulina sp. CCNP1310]MEA5420076.1 M3 family metallopeptidase [Spirulina sp. CCNP1310]